MLRTFPRKSKGGFSQLRPEDIADSRVRGCRREINYFGRLSIDAADETPKCEDCEKSALSVVLLNDKGKRHKPKHMCGRCIRHMKIYGLEWPQREDKNGTSRLTIAEIADGEMVSCSF